MNLNIKPAVQIVELTFGKGEDKTTLPGIQVTATRPVTSLVWEVMSQMSDLGIFDRDRDKDTVLHFWCNPGYTNDVLLPMVVAATYVAATYTNIRHFWSTPLGTHMNRIRSKVTYPELGTGASALMNTTITTWICYKALQVASNHADNLMRRRMTRSLTQDRITLAQNCINKLGFTDPSATAFGAERILKMVAEVEGYLPELEADHNTLCQVDDEITTIKRANLVTWTKLRQKLESAESADPTFYQEWVKFLDSVTEAEQKINTLVSSFDVNRLLPLVKKIKSYMPS